ncbi:MAG: amidohydrolase family protein [Cocleimonas sp.]|nr:amidohydrolase family protein [Cocleimonas sp.]
MLDVLIKNGTVYNGVDAEPSKNDIGIKAGKIVSIGEALTLSSAKQVIDARNLLVSPSFIDSHASEGYSYLRDDASDHKLYQGVSSELFGNCGYSPAPVFSGIEEEITALAEKIGFPFNWHTLDEYFQQMSQKGGTPINVATLVGHNTLRGGIAKDVLNVTACEIDRMSLELKTAMEQGAFGLSSGLIYTPGCYATTDELITLAKTTQTRGGFYASHIRNERDQLEQAVEEALHIGKVAQVPVLISHLKAAEQHNWGKVPQVIAMIEAFREQHQHKVSFDVYPYTAVSTRLKAFIPAELLAKGSDALRHTLKQEKTRVYIADHLKTRKIDLSKMLPLNPEATHDNLPSIATLAAQAGVSAYEQVCNLLQQNPESWMVYTCLSEHDMDSAVLWKDSMICSDSWSYPVNAATDIGEPHPRTYGAFSRFLDQYTFSNERLSYGEAVRKITAVPARFIGFKQRGELREGFYADIVLMNPNNFADKASYSRPRQFSEGVEHLLINGQFSIQQQQIVNRSTGAILRHE